MVTSAFNDFAETDHQAQLGSALADARMLLAFAAQTNRGLDAELVQKITATTQTLEQGLATSSTPSASDEAAFWTAYDALAVALAPVSAESIRYTLAARKGMGGRDSFSPAAVTAFLGLVLFIWLQIYLLSGTELLKQIKDAEAEQAKPQASLSTLATAFQNVQARQVAAIAAAKRATPEKSSDELQKTENEFRLLQEQVRQQQTELQTATDKVEQAQLLLKKWYSPLRKVLSLVDLDEEILPKQSQCAQQDAIQVLSDCAQHARQDAQKARAVRTMAMLILVSLSTYLTPALLGILGAVTYVLRNISLQLSNFTYVHGMRGSTIGRITLGAVGGVIGSVLLTSGTSGDTVLKMLPPIGVPFLMGYAVEVFFVFLDKIVSTFTTTNPPAKAGG